MLAPIVPRIWIAIEGDKLKIIEDGTMELTLEREKHPEKEFIEIANVEGDIGALVNLAMKTCIEKAVKETRKDLLEVFKSISEDMKNKQMEIIEFCKKRLEELEKNDGASKNLDND